MRIVLTVLLSIAFSSFSYAEKDAAYWNKMADGMSQALIKNFWEPVSRDIPTVIILITVVISPI